MLRALPLMVPVRTGKKAMKNIIREKQKVSMPNKIYLVDSIDV